MLKVIVIRFLTWLFVRLGWITAQLLDPNAPEFQPVIHEHPLFTVEAERLNVKRCIMGENQWFTFLVVDQQANHLGGVVIEPGLEDAGIGTVIDEPCWFGVTRGTDGALRFRHTCYPCSYSIYVEGDLLVSNVRTDLPWVEYANGQKSFVDIETARGIIGGWLAVNKPGYWAYWFYLRLK